MAQELAAAYYSYHQQQRNEGTNKPLPVIPDVFTQDGQARMYTAWPMQAYSASTLAPSEAWQEFSTGEEYKLALAYNYATKKSGTTRVLMIEDFQGRDRQEVLARMKAQILQEDDYDSDLYLMMVLQLMGGNRNENGNVWITAPQCQRYRQNKENDWERMKRWEQCYQRMRNKWIELDDVEIFDDTQISSRAGKRRRSRISRRSQLFMFGEEIYHKTIPMDGIPTRSYLAAWEYREATWMLPFVQGANAYTGALMQDMLNLDPEREQFEKRLAKYFFWWLRTNARHEKKPQICIRDLFDLLHLPIDKQNPQRTQDRFEQAMDRLAAKIPRVNTQSRKGEMLQQHLTWDYAEEFRKPSKNWLETWLQQKIIVNDPPELANSNRIIQANAHVIEERKLLAQEIREQKEKEKKKRGRPKKQENLP